LIPFALDDQLRVEAREQPLLIYETLPYPLGEAVLARTVAPDPELLLEPELGLASGSAAGRYDDGVGTLDGAG
jgi:hypothetical protein